jgi:hypothetical protein
MAQQEAQLREVPRNKLLGMIADALSAASSPQRTQAMQGMAAFLGIPAVAATANRMSYGEPLTTGKGMTTKMKPETEEALTNLLSNLPTPGKAAVAGAGLGAQILLHGGPNAITKVAPERLGAVGTVFGPGFYTSNKSVTPITYARNARDVGAGTGAISIFDLPDELYAKTLQLTDKPLASQPGIAVEVSKALNSDSQLFDLVMAELQKEVQYSRRRGVETNATKALTGEWLDSVLNEQLGKSQASALLAKHGIPGKTWDAGKDETHTVVYPEYLNQLESVGSVPLFPQDKLIDNALKYLIKEHEATK